MTPLLITSALLACLLLACAACVGPGRHAKGILAGIALTFAAVFLGNFLADALLASERAAAERIAAELFLKMK